MTLHKKMKKKPKVLFVYQELTPRYEKELELLKEHFDVRISKGRLITLSRARLSPWIRTLASISRVLKSDIVYSRSGSWPAYDAVYLSNLLGKKSVVVIGGREVYGKKEYGLLNEPKNEKMVQYILEKSDKVLVVDDSLRQQAVNILGAGGDNIVTVPNGFDSGRFVPKGKKDDMVLSAAMTSAGGQEYNKVRLKGLDTFVRAAAHLPGVRFTVVGVGGKDLRELKSYAPDNLEFVEVLPQDELISYYQRAKVYCQLSIREGHPNSLCEAMLCGCVPVGTDIPGIRNVIGGTGYIVPYGDAKATADAISRALKSGDGLRARGSIKDRFPLEKREKALADIVGGLLG